MSIQAQDSQIWKRMNCFPLMKLYMLYIYFVWLSFDVSKEKSYKLIEKVLRLPVALSQHPTASLEHIHLENVSKSKSRLTGSGLTQHEIYRWVIHIYPRIYQVIIMNFREYCLLFLIFCSTETQKRTNRGNFFANFLEQVIIVSIITLIWGAWHFCMLSFLMLIFPWQKVHWCKYLCCLLVSCSIVDTHLLLQSYVSVLVAYLPASISLGTSTESLLIFPSPFGPLSYSPIGLQALPGLGINMRIRIWLNWP